jgi:aminobenzoyl-glutamate utilization protein B
MLQAHAIEMLREHIPPGGGGEGQNTTANTMNYTISDAGPEFASVVPDHAELWVIGRFTTSETMLDVVERINKTARGAAMATETEVEIQYIAMTHEMIPNETLSKVLYDNFVEQGPPKFTDAQKKFLADMQKEAGQDPWWHNDIKAFGPSTIAVVDSSEYTWFCPYCELMVNLGPGPGWHNWMVTACAGSDMGHVVMNKVANVMASAAADMACNPDLLAKAQAEWKERMGSRKYSQLLPKGTPVPLGVNKATMDKYRPMFEND